MNVQKVLRYEEPGLPEAGQIVVPWLVEKLDPSAILSRTAVKTGGIDCTFLENNIQRHEARRGWQFAQLYNEMVQSVGLKLSGAKILEVGAGPGGVCLGLHEVGGKVVSLDLVDGRIFYDEDVPFLLASGTDLPFRDGSFDFLSLTSVLHHLPIVYRDEMLNEALRVADVLLIQEDCLTNRFTNFALKLVDNGVSGEIGTHQAESHMTRQGWLNYFSDRGLTVKTSRDYSPKWLGVSMKKTFFVVSKNQ